MTEESFDILDQSADDGLTEAIESEVSGAKVLVLRDYCVRLKGAECSRCSLACPHDAITYNEKGLPLVNQDLCTGCGICFGICDAFSSNRVTLIDLHERVKRIALRGDAVYFTCRENIFTGLQPATNVIVLPCLACLPPEFWTLVLSENIKINISCDLSYCTDCKRAGDIAETLYTHAIGTAEKQTKKKIRFSETIPEKEDILKDLSNPEGVDRRSAFTNLVGDVGDIASGKRRLRNSEVLQQFLERRERSRAIAQLNLTEADELNDFAPLGHIKKTMMPKRKMILEAIQNDPEIADRITLYLAHITDESVPYDSHNEKICPTGALFPDPNKGTICLDERYCIGCEICTETYPESAIELIETNAERFIIPKEGNEEADIRTEEHL